MTEAEIIANLDGDITVLAKGLREAQARCDEYVAQNSRQALRLTALEGAARDLLDVLPESTADAIAILPERKYLAEVLEGRCTAS